MASGIRVESEKIRRYILEHAKEPGLAALVMAKFGISRQAANRHLRMLVQEGSIRATGKTQSRSYRLTATETKTFAYDIQQGLEEGSVWTADIRPLLNMLPENVLAIWHWAFTEMFNNAIDHSEGTKITVEVTKTALTTQMMVDDNGVGIFRKLQEKFHLSDERQALLELSKGKLTTDPSRHSGQGIFFTSRMVNEFTILSGGVYFTHKLGDDEDWLLENKRESSGTAVFMSVDNHTARTTTRVLAQYSVGNTYGFNKTVVPVELARYGMDQLISRSQAKRVLARVDQFAQVLFDFTGIDEIGQAFADEIFRVFAQEHPKTKLLPIHENKQIRQTISAAIKAGRPGYKG